MSMRKYQLAFMLLFLFMLLMLLISDNLTLDSVREHKLLLGRFVEAHYSLSVLLFFAACAVFVNSPVPFAALIKVLGGFFFGFYYGAVYNISATLLACVLGFALSRYAFKDAFEKAYGERLADIEHEIEENGFYYFLGLRLTMVVPYFLINFVAGISRLSFRRYAASTVLGVIPASLVYANGGTRLEQIESIGDLFQIDTVLALCFIASLSLVPLAYRKVIDGRRGS